jgi:HipA-like protein
MIRKFKKWFGKTEGEAETKLPKHDVSTFILKVDNIEIGTLHSENGEWQFSYSEDFKNHYFPQYNRIVGFPELDKIYKEDTLWPFFRIRIPGLKQPAVKEILEKEKIDQTNEAALLKRFGNKTIANPYELELLA